MSDHAQAVKDAVAGAGGLSALAERLDIKVQKNGKMAHCPDPSHGRGDKNASLSFFDGNEAWKCHACGSGGDAFNLWTLVHGGGFKEALAGLADMYGVDIGRKKRHLTVYRNPKHKQGKTAEKPSLDLTPQPLPSIQARRFLDEIWGVVKDIPNTRNFTDWMSGRRIKPEVARELGWRDWQPAIREIGEVWRRHSSQAREDAGLERDGKPWYPLTATREGKPGAFIPAFHPNAHGPIGFRWRSFDPAAKPKTFSPFGSTPVFGLSLPPAPSAGLAWLSGAHKHQTVIIVEGEPDWLTAAQTWQSLAGILCLTNVSGGWPAQLTTFLDAAERVVCMVHDVHGKRVLDGLTAALIQRRGPDFIKDGGLIEWLVDENNDLNDQHRNDKSTEVFDKVAKIARLRNG